MKRANLNLRLALVHSVICVLYAFLPNVTEAQNWTKLIQLQNTIGSSAFFFNAQEGLIGTGHYFQSETPAQIYHTENGGVTWKLSQIPNPNIHGEVTDIFFRDRLNGWATITESTETGWSGVYRSTDGGLTWNRTVQAGFPAGIRETSRGVFYTDRDVNPGIKFSSNEGATWTQIATTLTALGIDFMDDLTGFVTTQASDTDGLFPHLMTTDGGLTWRSIESLSEAWTPYGDPITRQFFLASERDQLTSSTETAILKVPVSSAVEGKIRTYGDSGLSGGIAGSHICKSVIYVQGRKTSGLAPGGIIRSTDGGGSWVFVGGPNTIYDKRFAVTGRGAVVIAFDDSGGVWRTTNGGDGTLSPSILPYISIAQPVTIPAHTCDTQSIPIIFRYSSCDSARISNVNVLNDSESEISVPNEYGNFFSSSRGDTLGIVYRPMRVRNWSLQVTLTIQQPDGYTEDTTISIPLSATASKTPALEFISGHNGAPVVTDTINFDSVSTCADGDQSVTLANIGCGNSDIDSMQTSGPPFVIASNFNPFDLSSGDERTFLIRYAPDSIRADRGILHIYHDGISDSVILIGTGYSAGNSVSLAVSDSIVAPQCDSAVFSIALRNIACKAFLIDSIITNAPFRSLPLVSLDSLQPGAQSNLGFVFTPNKAGPDTGTVHLAVSYARNGSYDTVLQIVGIGGLGKPAFSVSRSEVQLGTVGVCSEISDTLLISSNGCSPVTVAASFDTMNGFSLLNAPEPMLAPGDSDIITINYQPNKAIGLETANLILTTSAGTDTIPVSVTVRADSGSILLNAPQNISEYVCKVDTFSISITNSLCDSIVVDNISLSGTNAGDFALNDTVPIALASNEVKSINGIFAPQDSLTRSANVSVTIRKSDGSRIDTLIAITAQGIGVPPIEVTLGATSFAAPAGSTVTIPIVAVRGSETAMNTLDFDLILNSDLLTPMSFNGNGVFGNAVTKNITVNQAHDGSTNDTAIIHLQLPSEAVLPAGELCEIVCSAYVTKSLSTNIMLENVSFHDASGSAQCLLAERVPDTTAIFTLTRECGDTTLAYALGFNSIEIQGISPNPTTGSVKIQFAIPPGYANDAVLEIYDVLGEKLCEFPIIFPSGVSGEATMNVDLTSSVETNEGVFYLRLRTPLGMMGQAIPVSVIFR